MQLSSVNTVVKKDGVLYGYNTDFYGMVYMLSSAGIVVKDKSVMVLGSGGTGRTAVAVCKHLGAKKVVVVSRSGDVNYSNYKEQKDVQVIINTTPVGTYPNTLNAPIDLDGFDFLEGVADATYNPFMTKLLFLAKQKGVKYTNGLTMLVAQAKYAMDIFLDKKLDDDYIKKVYNDLVLDTQNVILIGMPGAGKTTVGKELSMLTGKDFIDIDDEIVKSVGMSIPDIFAKFGEDFFRQTETKVLSTFCKERGKIISTGGGVVKQKENLFLLKQNGVIFYIDRELSLLETVGRPLSKDIETLKILKKERTPLYNAFADYSVKTLVHHKIRQRRFCLSYEDFSYKRRKLKYAWHKRARPLR
jgi:shikimate dehydrogenase